MMKAPTRGPGGYVGGMGGEPSDTVPCPESVFCHARTQSSSCVDWNYTDGVLRAL